MASDLILSTYVYNSQSIDVPFTPEAFFNATVAAKPFGKRPADWLKTDETQAYIQAITIKIVIEDNQLVRVVSGAPETGGGTWLHPKLGMAFARWLDPFFALWCDEQIENILRRDLSVMTQTRIHGLLRGLLRDIDKTHDAFVRQGMVSQARPLFAALGIPMPDLSLLGKPANQTRLEV